MIRIRACTFLLFLFIANVSCGGCDDTGTRSTSSRSDAGAPDGAVLGDGCVDEDEDGFPSGLTCEGPVDCDDTDAAVHPEASEACGDGVDNDCDGAIDPGCPECAEGETRACGQDVGACTRGVQTCVDNVWSECEGATLPRGEICNGVDDDCDGEVDEDPESICDDGQMCNGQEVCEQGQCVADPVDCSMHDSACTVGVCSEKDGGCVARPLENGTACDDGLFCTEGTVCEFGTCGGGTARDCSGEGDQCNQGVCDEDQDACVAQPVSDGTSCDDGLFCTQSDSCTAGVCGGLARDCSGAADQCNAGVCDEASDACVSQPIADDTPCDDGLYCTVGESCQTGVCGAGAARECGVAGGSCRDGVCDEATDSCTGDPVADGTPCDDSLFCTVSDSCVAGTCVGGAARDCAAVGDQCNDGVCNETMNLCQPQAKGDGTPCDDGLYCTDGDACQSGSCSGGPRDCSVASDECNLGVCDETQSSCVPQPLSDGTACEDGLFCTVNDRCNSGACTREPRDCSSEDDQCNEGVCDESGDQCVPQPLADGTSCDDGVNCTVSDTCSSGSCGGEAIDCAALTDQCNTGMCDETTGGCIAVPVVDGTSCDDGLNCTANDVCGAGSCQGAPVDCSAMSDACNVGSCDEASGACVATPVTDGTTCDDGDACTTGDTCTSGTCGGGARDCSHLTDACNTGMCDASTGNCVAVPVNDGTACDDGLTCTTNDQCTAGTCAGGPVDCSGVADQCNSGACDEASGGCVAVPHADGTTCDDGVNCTVSDECMAGACEGTLRDCSGHTDQCNTGACDETTGDCVALPVTDGTPCDDGAWCNVGESCQSGTCTGGAARDCSGATGGDSCKIPMCDEPRDQCYATNDPTCCDVNLDADLDGSNECDDCDETNGSIYPGAAERCNGLDDDCDGLVDEDFDLDSDGFSVCANDPLLFDCDDNNPGVNPGTPENCGGDGTGNGVDDNCNGYVDEGCDPCTTTDVDGDGYSECDGDCDDNDATRYPGAFEACDGKDSDCNIFTRANCEVSQGCNHDQDGSYANDPDICADDMLCACVLTSGGQCNGDYRCTSYCNSSDTGELGDGCGADQTCVYDIVPATANLHGCGVRENTPGSARGGEACNDDSDCRNLSCYSHGVGRFATKFCRDFCASDAYCGTDASCRLFSLSSMDGMCYPNSLLGSGSVGTACAGDSDCDHLFCNDDPTLGTSYCSEPCCTDSDCPSGFTCSTQGEHISTNYVFPDPNGSSCSSDADCSGEGGVCYQGTCAWRLVDTSPMCVPDAAGQGSRRAGQSCSSNAQCESNFCDANLGVCVEVCCNDSTCPVGLTCEKQTIETVPDHATQARICVNLSTEDVFERM